MLVRRHGPAAIALLALASCATLEEEPWARSSRGDHQITFLTGSTYYKADIEAEGQDGPLMGLPSSDTTTLDPAFGAQLEYAFYLRDDLAVGAGAGVRRFDPTGIQLYGAGFDADEFQSTHLFLISRYMLPPFGSEKRWRPILGVDLGVVPEVDLDATVDYGGGLTEAVRYGGDSFWWLGFRAALSYLMTDALSLELGTFYELPLTTSDATFTVNIPNAGPSNIAGELSPAGFVFFLGLTWHL